MSDSVLDLWVSYLLKQPELLLEVLCHDYVTSEWQSHKLVRCQNRIACCQHCVTLVPNPWVISWLKVFLSEIQYIKHLLLIDVEYDNSYLKLAHSKFIQTGLGPLTNDYQTIVDIVIHHDIPYVFSQNPHDFVNIQVCTWAIKFYSTISHLSMLTIPSKDLGSMYKITQSLPDHYACLIQASPDLHDDIYQLYHPNPASSLS